MEEKQICNPQYMKNTQKEQTSLFHVPSWFNFANPTRTGRVLCTVTSCYTGCNICTNQTKQHI